MTKPRAVKRHLPTSPFKAPVTPPTKSFDSGDRVLHSKYGLGRIVSIEDGIATLVDFGSLRVRIAVPYTSIEKL